MKTIKFKVLRKKFGLFLNAYSKSPNTTDVIFENARLLYSYDSLVAVVVMDKENKAHFYLTNKHDVSQSTNKAVVSFCSFTKAERIKGLENGTITLITDIHLY